MLISETVFVKINGRNINYYKDLGYKSIKYNDVFEIGIEELSIGSHIIVDVNCDYCKQDYTKPYKSYLTQKFKSIIEKDCCKNCIQFKTQEVMISKYGVENCMELDNIKQKNNDSKLINYPLGSQERKDMYGKIVAIWNSKTDDEKLERKEKIKQTNIERYGVGCPLQLESSREKLFETRKSASSQQIKIHEIVSEKYGRENTEINFYFSSLCLDVFLRINDVNIDIEYDSWYWHEKQRDRRRDEVLKSKGFKILRIKSGHKLPNEQELFSKIDRLVNSSYKYREIILDDWDEEKYDGRVDK